MKHEVRGSIRKTTVKMDGVIIIVRKIGSGIYLVANSKKLRIKKCRVAAMDETATQLEE